MDCSPSGSSVHVISPARILEWVAIFFSRGSSWPRDRTHSSWIGRGFFPTEPPGKPQPWDCQGFICTHISVQIIRLPTPASPTHTQELFHSTLPNKPSVHSLHLTVCFRETGPKATMKALPFPAWWFICILLLSKRLYCYTCITDMASYLLDGSFIEKCLTGSPATGLSACLAHSPRPGH